ncbi:MAG TPA: hypothetical protein VLD39_04755, partial [Gammaproteobacteria bacterium]|nr:hypothetical protein [Gammaproteobacteria bacterium]
PLEVRVEVIRPVRDPFGGFGLTEGRVAEVRRRSAPITVSVRPAPVKADAVGQFRMQRSEPVVSAEGLVTFDVTVEGTGSLRSMPAPRFSGNVEGEVEVQEVDSKVTGRAPMRMRRVWRYVIFPRASGSLDVPAVESRVYAPGESSAKILRAPPTTVNVVLSESSAASASTAEVRAREIDPARIAAGAVLLLALVTTVLVFRRARGGSAGELKRIVAAAGHTLTIRKRMEEAVTRRERNPVALYGESSELGEAWRAAMSLVDRLEKEPESIERPAEEVRARAQRLLEELDAASSRRRA